MLGAWEGGCGGDGEGVEREGEGGDGFFVAAADDEGDDGGDDGGGGGREKDKLEPEKSPTALTPPALLSALVSLIAWEDGARELRKQQEGVVAGLEAMGIGKGKAAEEARGVVGRLRGVMARVAEVRWGMEDCLVLMGEEGSGMGKRGGVAGCAGMLCI